MRRFADLDLAHRLADAAGEIARAYFRTPADWRVKSDRSPVTIADEAIEAEWRRILAAERPQDGIMGEEQAGTQLTRPYVWVLDPIDGTRAFFSHRPTFTHLIALCSEGRPILGIIDQPVTGERWVGMEDVPTTRNGHSIHTAPQPAGMPDWTRVRWGTTGPLPFRQDPAAQAVLDRAIAHMPLSVWGGDAYAFATLAGGGLDLMIETGLAPYDVMALVPVIQGAGGTIAHWDGSPCRLEDGRGDVLAAASAPLARAARSLLMPGV